MKYEIKSKFKIKRNRLITFLLYRFIISFIVVSIILYLLYRKTSILEFETGIMAFLFIYLFSLIEYKKNVISTLIAIESKDDKDILEMKYSKNNGIVELKMNLTDINVVLKNPFAVSGVILKFYNKGENIFSFSDNMFWTSKQVKTIYEELNNLLKDKQNRD